ncbi:MAG: fumarate hydratase [Endomicrobium sp.]|jgi:fumarate hydratase subunit alpha|nr:fumarate hydratase [Endomicrobium sp.]
MRKIKSRTIINTVQNLCADANFELPMDVLKSLEKRVVFERGIARDILEEIIENAFIAKGRRIPLCQDTGTANFFVKLGDSMSIEGENIYYAINKGVSLGYTRNYLRKSIVLDPLERKNTQDNTPANIYIEIVPGDKIEITFLAKGGGSENASSLKMLTPSAGWNGIKEFVLNTLNEKGRNACPPLIVGVGIGGDFSSVGLMSKKALIREIGSENKNIFYSEKEKELLDEINKLDIGPMGICGITTALAVFIETKPVHIASLPASVNIQCHSFRRKTVII